MPEITAPASRRGIGAWVGQILLYGLFAGSIGVFSHWPPYRQLAPDQALVKVSFVHSAQPMGDCRRRTAAELAALPPNMRAPVVCPRGRSPVVIEVDLDGQPALRRSAPPSGLSGDGASALYERIVVPAGEHRVAVRLNDDARQPGFTYQRETTLTLASGQALVIDFNPAAGGITLR